MAAITPFRIAVPDADLEDLRSASGTAMRNGVIAAIPGSCHQGSSRDRRALMTAS
ncbi:MAG TPA: hypothetical protein VHH12_01595 [Mycobacterium sp.]|nr:hypothetical protein [Mycobacterium sp.]